MRSYYMVKYWLPYLLWRFGKLRLWRSKELHASRQVPIALSKSEQNASTISDKDQPHRALLHWECSSSAPTWYPNLGTGSKSLLWLNKQLDRPNRYQCNFLVHHHALVLADFSLNNDQVPKLTLKGRIGKSKLIMFIKLIYFLSVH